MSNAIPLPYKDTSTLLEELAQGRKPSSYDLDMFRQDLRGTNPRYRQMMRYLKLNNPDILPEEDPLKKAFRRYQESDANAIGTDEDWNGFREKMAPDIQGRTLRDILSDPVERPPQPEMPKVLRGPVTNSYYQLNAPAPNRDYVFVGDRSNFKGSWQRIGDPITEKDIGKITANMLKKRGANTFEAQHHNANISPGASLSDEDLKSYLDQRGISSEGDREGLMKRYIYANESVGEALDRQIQNRYLRGDGFEGPLQNVSDDLLKQGVMEHQRINDAKALEDKRKRLQEANQLRQERLGLRETNVNPIPARPPRTGLGFQNQPMEINHLNQGLRAGASAQEVAQAGSSIGNAGATEVAGAGTLGRASSFASRALPVINLALLAGTMMQNFRANRKNRYAEQAQKSMRT